MMDGSDVEDVRDAASDCDDASGANCSDFSTLPDMPALLIDEATNRADGASGAVSSHHARVAVWHRATPRFIASRL
jgi:hypothetical protein